MILLTVARPPRLALLVAVVLALATCRPRETDAPPAPQAVAPPLTIWAWVGDAPAWVHVDLDALRADARARALWDAAGSGVGSDPLGAALGSADTLVIAWRDAAFAQRVNVLHGDVGATEVRAMLARDGFAPYTAGRDQVWSHPGHAWAVALPGADTLVTGAPEAVRAAVATPCTECDVATMATITARLRVDALHRRLATAVLDSPALDRLLAAVASAEATLDLGVGADVVVRLHGVEGADLSFAAQLLDEVLSALERATSDRPEAAVLGALLRRARLEIGDGVVELYWELGRDDVDALVALLVADVDPTVVEPAIPALAGGPPEAGSGDSAPTRP